MNSFSHTSTRRLWLERGKRELRRRVQSNWLGAVPFPTSHSPRHT